MRKAVSFVLFATLVAASAMTATAWQQARPVSTSTTNATPEEVLKAVRSDMRPPPTPRLPRPTPR